MAVTYNIKGTTNTSFKVGKQGTGTAFLNTLSGSTINFKNGDTDFASISDSSSDLIIKSEVSDKDILIKGNDGGSEITALSFDMSTPVTLYPNVLKYWLYLPLPQAKSSALESFLISRCLIKLFIKNVASE